MTAKKTKKRAKKVVKHFNKLSPAEAERLALLLEELGEAQQAVGKILRHGYESGWDGSNNRQDLTKELGDVEYAVALMRHARDLDGETAPWVSDKAECCPRFLHHQPSWVIEAVQEDYRHAEED